ncbi:MAG: GNAT family N-acetyltransferase [FCB group bacterium]|jgi:predicted acetyltransferase|nr:GNAT family N-acetyltransferase [FCB group bacterium]
MELAIKPAESPEELRLAHDLIAKEHAPDPGASRYWLETFGGNHPGHEVEHTRIAVAKGEIAGALRITTETVRIGEARLRIGGLGWLTTASRHRGKGIAAMLLEDALAYLKTHKYHAALLFGNQDIFRRYGFATSLADYTVAVETAEAARFESTYKRRPAKPGDIPALQRIHAANDATTDGSILRTRAHLTSKWNRCAGWSVLTDAQGKVVAYFAAAPGADHLAVFEVGIADTATAGGVLGACAQLAHDDGFGRIRFHVPPRHPFARFLLQFRSLHETHILGEGAGMMAVVDIAETLESMIPEWESLLAQSIAHEYRTEVALLVDGTPYRIRTNRASVDVAAMTARSKVSLTRADMVHLVMGYRHLADILANRPGLLSSEARTLLHRIFPKRDPYITLFDRF